MQQEGLSCILRGNVSFEYFFLTTFHSLMANLGKVCNLTFVRIDQLTQYNILNGNNIEEIFIFDILQ